ncbi:MAG: hypothetical protein ABI444_00610 [Candidatus Kapaibacterium sp.]
MFRFPTVLQRVILFVACILLLTQATPCKAQWRQVASFPDFPRTVYFLDLPNCTSIGFVGLWNGDVYRTSDAGVTWNKCYVPGNAGSSITAFTFKDSLTGWLSTKFRGSYLYKTNDGGLTWSSIWHYGQWSSIYYHIPSKRLFASDWNVGAYYSDNDGATFTTFSTLRFNGFEFTDDIHGMLSELTGANGRSILLTSDGGFTWSESPEPFEAWQPGAAPSSRTLYTACEQSQQIRQSTDAGVTWASRATSPGGSGLGSLGGCIRVDSCGYVYAQTIGKGILQSKDEGLTWQNIGGPGNVIDSKFIIHQGMIYAAESNLLSLWAYQLPPQSSKFALANQFSLSSLTCDPIDSVLTFEAIASVCSGVNDSLLSASITGATDLSLINTSPIPRVLQGADSLRIRYTPSEMGSSDAILNLRFLVNGKILDTTIHVSASSPVLHESINPALTLLSGLRDTLLVVGTNANTTNSFNVKLSLNRTVPNWVTINSLDFELHYDNDLLTPISVTPALGWRVASNTSAASVSHVKLTRSTQFVINTNDAIATMAFSPCVSPNTIGRIHLGDVLLNGDSSITNGCNRYSILGTDDVTVTVASSCGDSLICESFRHALIGGLTVHPNPTQNISGLVSVQFELFKNATVQMTLEDMLGREVKSLFRSELTIGVHQISIDRQSIAEGNYVLRIEATDNSGTIDRMIRKIEIERAR